MEKKMENEMETGGNIGDYLEGHGDLVSRLITPISHRIPPIISVLTYLQSPHDPPSKGFRLYLDPGCPTFLGIYLTEA